MGGWRHAGAGGGRWAEEAGGEGGREGVGRQGGRVDVAGGIAGWVAGG